MGRLTSSANNSGGCAPHRTSMTISQSVTVGVLAFLVHRVTAVPVPPSAPLGCCVSYGVTYDHTECCHEFAHTTDPTECQVMPGWVGGGMRFHAASCEETQALAMYQDATEPQDEQEAQAAAAAEHDDDSTTYTTMVIDEEALSAAEAGDGAGCCVSFGLTGAAECCHEFTDSSEPEECALPPGWVGGGRRYHSTNCDDTQSLTQYNNLAAAPELEPPAGESDMGGWVAAVYTEEQQARLGVDMWGDSSPDSAAIGGQKIVKPTDTATVDEEKARTEDTEDVGTVTGRTQPVSYHIVGAATEANGYGYGDDDQHRQSSHSDDNALLSITDDEDDDALPMVIGGSESLGPAWTQDATIEPPAGEQDTDDGYTIAVYTPEQQARLGVDESGASLPDDEDHTTADVDGEEEVIDLTEEEQQAAAADAFQAAGFPGILPVITNWPAEEGVQDAVDGPCHPLPETSMVIVEWNPLCDEASRFLPLQCGRSGNCWCVDEAGERIDVTVLLQDGDIHQLDEPTCLAAREAAETPVEEPDALIEEEQEVDTATDDAPLLVTEATQTSFSRPEAYPADDDDGNDAGDEEPKAQQAPTPRTAASTSQSMAATPTVQTPTPTPTPAPSRTGMLSSSAGQGSSLSPQRQQLFALFGVGVVGLVLLSALVMMGVHRCRTSRLRVSAYAGFQDAQEQGGESSEYQRATQGSVAVPNWSRSWVVSGVGLGDSVSAPVEPRIAPPGPAGVDRVSLVGMPQQPATMQFSTGGR